MQIKKLPLFYKVFFLCWGIALTLLAIALVIVRTYLADYESTQPKYVADEVFEEYFCPADFKAILDFSGEKASKFESNEVLASYLDGLTEGKELSYYNVSSGLSLDTSKYTVKYTEDGKDIKVASFTLEKTDEKSAKGFSKYALSEFELFYPASKHVEIKATKGSLVYVNGVLLDESYISEDNVKHESFDHMPEGVEGVLYTLYSVKGLTNEPTVTVTAADGTALNVKNEAEDLYVTELVYDEALKAEQAEYVIKAAKAYAAYMQNDLAFNKVSPYFEKGTTLYESIRTTLLWAVIDHDSYLFEGEEASEFYRYDENTFSCRVRLTHVLKRSRLQDYRDNVDLTFYLRKIDGKYLIYDRTNN